jgi:hypothetical protein
MKSLDIGLKADRQLVDIIRAWESRARKDAMNPHRASAYRRIVETLADLGPAKLLEHEQDRIRYAADNLIFCADLSEDAATREALGDAAELCRALVESGRWEQVTATRLANDLCDCAPAVVPDLQAA